MKEEIAIIYTTFLRDWLFNQTVRSISDNCKENNFLLLIGDQGRDGGIYQSVTGSPVKMRHIWTNQPFDCGVSFSRNNLIATAHELGIKYCLLTADSIKFIPETVNNLNRAVQFLENSPDIGILGFDLKDRVPWEYFMDIQNNRFMLKKNSLIETDPSTGLRIKRCDICRQFFLGKIDTILSVKWDEQLKTGEHEDFFWRYKQSGYKVCWTPDITAQYIDYKPAEYLKYRMRQYNEFREILFKKHNLNDWVQYCE